MVSTGPRPKRRPRNLVRSQHADSIMMVKTHLSLTHDPNLKGALRAETADQGCPGIWRAKFSAPWLAISLMPGTGSNPAYRRIDVDTKTGQ